MAIGRFPLEVTVLSRIAYAVMRMDWATRRRWILIQWHRAEIGRLLGKKSRRPSDEIARRMNAIAKLCDCGRTPEGRMLAESLVESGFDGLRMAE